MHVVNELASYLDRRRWRGDSERAIACQKFESESSFIRQCLRRTVTPASAW